MRRFLAPALLAAMLLPHTALAQKMGYMNLFTAAEAAAEPHVVAPSRTLEQDFIDGQWEGILAASDGNTYFSVSSHSPDRNGQFYVYDPRKDTVRHIIDIGTWCGETDSIGKLNTQGKIHSQIFEADGKLYCSTTSAHMPEDFPYKGGHFLSYDLATGECKDLGVYEDSQGGLLTMLYEPVYKRLYAISQGEATLIYYDLETGKIVKVGSVENSPHQCRVLVSDKRGNVYGSTWDGMVYQYDPKLDRVRYLLTRVPHDPDAPQPPRGPYTQLTRYDGKIAGWLASHWVMMCWDEKTQWWYGVRGNDEYLFRFRPPTDDKAIRCEVEGLAPFGFRPSKEAQPRFASLGMCILGRDVWYCSYPVWQSQAHLMSYNIDSGKVTNHGKIVTDGNRRVSEIHSLVPGSDGKLHAVAMVWSIQDKDPANDWGQRAQCYIHSRFLTIDPKASLRKP